ncbi:MAG TPA: hypothetical protein EYH34_04405 [Planctomycetes bacterium]|nr:hypothetical protein [Planctomycetota bacterium]
MTRPAWFRQALDEWGERCLLGVPSNTLMRDLEIEPSEPAGRGRRARRPFEHVQSRAEGIPAAAWTHHEVLDGEKGPLVVQIVKRRLVAKIDGKVGWRKR